MELLNDEFLNYVYAEVLKCPFVSGADEFIKKHYKKYLFFVVSGTPDKEIKSIVKERGLGPFFVNVYGSPQDKTVLISKILKDYKIKPEQVLFVGDAINDYEGARNMNIEFIGRVQEGKNNPFVNLNVKGIIKDLFDLENYLIKTK